MTEEAVELFQAVLGQMLQDRAVEGINDEAVGHQVHALLAGFHCDVDSGRRVAPVEALELQHAPPQLPRVLRRQALAASLGGV